MTTSVVSGSCNSRPDRLSSVQLATFTTLADWAADPADSAGSTMLSPWLSSKNVCSPNKSLSCGITGWSSGMARASNWPKVRSSCAELSFIARSFRFAPGRSAARYLALRGLPPRGGQCEARSSRAADLSSSPHAVNSATKPDRYWGTISEPRELSGRRKVELQKTLYPTGNLFPISAICRATCHRCPISWNWFGLGPVVERASGTASHRERVQRAEGDNQRAEGDNYANLDAACRCHPADCRGASFSPRGERSGATAFAWPVRAAAEYLGPKARRGGSCHRAGGDAQAGLSTADSRGGSLR